MNDTPRRDAIIIGGGPAGLFAAIRLAEVGSGVLLLERKEKPGRKLLLSGSGQCNITHTGEIADFLGHYGGGSKPESAARFLRHALFSFSNQDLIAWFRAQSLDFETAENGKIFPSDRRASSLLRVLLDKAERLGVKIETGSRVMGIDRLDSAAAGGFLVRSETAEYRANSVLIATGGASYPVTGSSGDGYALAASLGHAIVTPRASLVAVIVKDFKLAGLAGLSFQDAGLAIRRHGRRILSKEGDLLITHEGLSGPLILDASRSIEAGDILEIGFVKATPEAFRSRLETELVSNPRRLARTALADSGLARSMAEHFCELVGVGEEETAAALPRQRREALCRLACTCPFEVDRLGGLDLAMATAGGIELTQVNPKTMESRLVPGLFFAGEVLDIDGNTGGYNLQAAFSTGALAATGMLASLPCHAVRV